jgi:hypothetical protein
MRFLAVVVIAACGSSSKAPAHGSTPTSEASSGGSSNPPGDSAPTPPPVKPASFPAPPEGAPPKGTWHVTVEFPHLQARATSIAVDASGVYIAGTVLTAEDFRSRRWAVAKLDGAGAIAWSAFDELARSPAPERIVLAGGGVIAAGGDGSEEPSRLLLIARYEPGSGKRTWQRRFSSRDPKCGQPACGGKDSFGGIAVRGTSILFSATGDHPVEEAFGELSLAKGAPVKSYPTRTDLRAHDIAADDTGIYLLEDTLSNQFSLLKLAGEKTAWTQKLASSAARVGIGAGGVLLWGTTIEKRAADTGELAWTSKLTGHRIDVAADPTGLYASVMIDDKPAPYFALAKIDPANGAVQWFRKIEGAEANVFVATDKDWLYVFGSEGDKWFVERRRKADGALGEVQPIARSIDKKPKRK